MSDKSQEFVPFTVTGAVVPAEYGGLTEKERAKPIRSGVQYYINHDVLKPNPRNARLVTHGASFAPKITEAGRITDALQLIVRSQEPITLQDVIDGKVEAVIGKGHCRVKAVEYLAEHNPAFFAEALRNRIPVQFHINPSESDEMMLLHDHSGVNRLSLSEVCVQLGKLLKSMGLTAATWSLYRLLAEHSNQRIKVDQLDAKLTAGEINAQDHRKQILDTLHGLAQTLEHVERCPEVIRQYFYYCNDSAYCLAQNKPIPTIKLTRNDYKELCTIAAAYEGNPSLKKGEAKYKSREESIAASIKRFQAILDSKVPAPADGKGGEGGEGGDGDKMRAMSRKEIVAKLDFIQSDRFRNILLGVSGDATALAKWEEIDAFLTVIEKAEADAEKKVQLDAILTA